MPTSCSSLFFKYDHDRDIDHFLQQLWKDVTASNPWTTWVPLIFIFAVSAIRELFDEIKRAKADKVSPFIIRCYNSQQIANSKIIKCVVNGEIKKVHSEDLKVGDIIYISFLYTKSGEISIVFLD